MDGARGLLMASEHVTRPFEIASEPIATQQFARAEPSRIEHVRLRELLAVCALVCLADITIFRGHGYGGLALFWLLSPALLLLGRPRAADSRGAAVIALMMWLLAARAAWLGSLLGVAWGAVLLV